MIQRRYDAQQKAHHSTQSHGHAADLDAHGKTGFYELPDGSIFADIVAHPKIAFNQVGYIPVKLHVKRLIQPVALSAAR